MTSPAYDVAQYLVSEGVGAFGGDLDWAIGIDRLPDSPANAIAIYDTGGPGPIVTDTDFRQPTIQVRVRGLDWPAVRARQAEIYDLLQQPGTTDAPPRLLGEHEYVAMNLQGDILSLGADDGDRYNLVANYSLMRGPQEAS